MHVDLGSAARAVLRFDVQFSPGLTQTDFVIYEDDQPVDITHFNAERVPVSLGILLDTSGSMAGEKIAAARAALDRFLFDLLGPDDEVFLFRFDTGPHLVQGWTTDRNRISSELHRMRADGATALYDAVADALPLLQSGRHRKKALLLISDGNDTNSRTDLPTLKQLIRQSEALVYASAQIPQQRSSPLVAPAWPFDSSAAARSRCRFPFRGAETPPRTPPIPGIPPGTPRPPMTPIPGEPPDLGGRSLNEPVNVDALRDITDDSGGRTEIVRDPRDLDPTTARIADELSKQYYLGYTSRGHHDGRWHSIRVEVRDRSLRVRARRGYIAAS
jgi:VWFA-related protein